MMTHESLEVLIVDDSERDFRATRDLFVRAGEYKFAVRWASNYAAGLAEIVAGRGDVCLVDYDLQGKSGIELVREARRQGAPVPMILLSGHDASTLADVAERAGVDDCLPKWHLTSALLEQSIRYAIERRKLLARADEMERKFAALGRQVGTVAHDFNNMLTAIVCEAEHLRRTLPGDDPRHSGAQEIIGSSIRAAALARQLVLAARKQSLEPGDVDLNSMVTGLQRLLKRMGGTRVGIEIQLCDDASTVCGDLHQLEQVVVNLVANGRDAAPDGGHIRLTTRVAALDACGAAALELPEGEYMVLSVEDDGTGMTDEVRARLFEAFFTTKAAEEGTGLGLASALDIVSRSGGAIAVSSVLGVGSRMEVFLPRIAAREGDCQAVPDGSTAPRARLSGTGAESAPCAEASHDRMLHGKHGPLQPDEPRDGA